MKPRVNFLYLSCLSYIGLLIVSTVFAPFIIPDKTKYANEQFLNTALAPLGYRTIRLDIMDFKTGKSIESKTVASYTIVDRNTLKYIEDIPPRYHYPGWDVEQVVQYDNPVTIKNKYKRYYLGSDGFGRSLFSRLLLGVRISLYVGFLSVLFSAIIGVILGTIAGLGSKFMDGLIMFLINSIWSIPTLLLVFIVLLAVGKGLWNVVLAISLTLWVEVARVVRGQVKKIKQENYLLYAKSAAVPRKRLLFKYILPNIIGPLIIMLSSNFAIAILLEAGLSFLGFGVQPPAPSLGNILSENYGLAISGNLSIAFIPGLLIMSIVFVFNIVANQLRDRFDVKM